MRNNEDIVWLLYWIYFVCFAFGINGPTWRGQKQPSANRATCCKKLISASNKRSENLLKLVLIRGSIVHCIVGARPVSDCSSLSLSFLIVFAKWAPVSGDIFRYTDTDNVTPPQQELNVASLITTSRHPRPLLSRDSRYVLFNFTCCIHPDSPQETADDDHASSSVTITCRVSISSYHSTSVGALASRRSAPAAGRNKAAVLR